MSSLRKTVILVSIFFLLIYLIELVIPTFFVAFVEEFFGRLLPFIIVYYTYRATSGEATVVGVTAGITFGVLEMFVKIMALNGFSVLMLVPILAVHIPNSVMQSLVVNFGYKNKAYVLIPVIYIIAVFWHWLYNAYLYVV